MFHSLVLGFAGQMFRHLLTFTVDGVLVWHEIFRANAVRLADLLLRVGYPVKGFEHVRTTAVQLFGCLAVVSKYM